MINSPKISIIIAVYNGAETLQRCIDSIANQTYSNIELIIIDGGSTDGTVDIIKNNEGMITYWVSEKDAGMYDALSKGFDRAVGEWVHWVNADDVLLPWSCYTIVTFSKKHPNAKQISGITCWGDETANLTRIGRTPWYPRLLVSYGFFTGKGLGYIQQESLFFKKELWEELCERHKNTFKKLKLAGDYYLWKQFARSSKIYIVNNIVGYFCITGCNMSFLQKDVYDSEVKKISPNFRIGRIFRPLKITVEIIKTVMAKC